MFFHIDESGNSGNNLFDPHQPVLSYGVLSSRTNVDVLATREHAAILRKVGDDSLHASKLGVGGILDIADHIANLQKRFEFRFDYYFVDKGSYAVAMLFDAVFDAGLNKAVKWDWYWTPLRFPMVALVGHLADEELLKEAWDLRLTPRGRIDREAARIVKLLTTLLERLDKEIAVDKRMREMARDSLLFGIKNPLELDFGTDIQNAMSPNSVGFQFVLSSIANRLKAANRKALQITVDRQSQFNRAQVQTYVIRSQISAALRSNPTDREWYVGHPLHVGVREDVRNLISHFPEEKITIAPSVESVGLQLVDVYLWIVNRAIAANDLPDELTSLAGMLLRSSRVDGISTKAMMARFKAFERLLPQPEDISPELKARHESAVAAHRAKVQRLKLDE